MNPLHFLDILIPRVPRDPHATPYELAAYDDVVRKWRNTFAKNLRAKTGDWSMGGYEWHVFTYGYAAAITGAAAVDRYHQVKRGPAYIFTHAVRNPPCCLAPMLPSHQEITHALGLFPSLADIYILDVNLRWTFVVTHEDRSGLGPFFALPQ